MEVSKIGAGKYGDVFLVRHGNLAMAMRVSYYRDDSIKTYDEMIAKNDARGAMRAKQSDAVAVGNAFCKYVRTIMDVVSPHFVYLYSEIDIKSFTERMPLLAERSQALTANQKRYNNVAFMELFSSDLTKFLQTATYNESTLRGIVFQVVYSIAAMQYLLPGWRHNDLSTNNVLVKQLDRPLRCAYTTPDGVTRYTHVPVLVALNDYDFLHVPGHPKFQNQRVLGGRFKVNANDNTSYDTHFFLKSVLRCVAKKPSSQFPDTAAFFKALGLRSEDRQDVPIPDLAPALVLQNAYFDALKKPIRVDATYAIVK